MPEALAASTVTFELTVSAGAVVSRTVTVNVFVETLPFTSVAVTVTVVVPIAKVEFDGIDTVTDATPTASVAVGAYVACAPVGPVASTVTLGAVITGGVVSTTVTVNVAVAVFPAASFAVTVTDVVPNARIVPAVFENVSDVTPTASVAVEVNVPTSQPVDCVASTVMFGAVITGAVVSRTVTVNVFVEVLFAASLAVTVTVVVADREGRARELRVGDRHRADRVGRRGRGVRDDCAGRARRLSGQVRAPGGDHRGRRVAHRHRERLRRRRCLRRRSP